MKDYSTDLIVCTEREKFLVPVMAQGSRPLLELPDLVRHSMVVYVHSSVQADQGIPLAGHASMGVWVMSSTMSMTTAASPSTVPHILGNC